MAHSSSAPISPALAQSSSSDRALSDRDREMTSTIPGPPPIPFKLHTRRGSRSAPDPWALGPLTSANTHDHNPAAATSANVGGAFSPPAATTPSPAGVASNLSTPTGLPIPIPSSGASRITIVRVHDREDSIDAGDMSDGTPSSFGVTAPPPRPGRSNSWGSNYSSGSNASAAAVSSSSPNRSHSPARRPGNRMTFAFTSFTPINPPTPSPTTERGRPFSNKAYSSSAGGSTSTPGTPGNVSPTHTYSPLNQREREREGHGHHQRRHSNPGNGLAPIKPSLTAQQIYELALSSTNSANSTSTNDLTSSALSSAGTSPIHTSSMHHYSRANSHSRPTTPGLTGPEPKTSPAVFRPMPDEVYLPFIDRPAEVAVLLSEHPTSRLYHLLEALFPASSVKAEKEAAKPAEDREEEDPAKWSFARLSQHLTQTTRAEMDDKTWVDAARACIRGRSEALWERFKGALGVPAELEVEPEDEEDLEEAHPILPDLHDVGAGPAGMSGYAASTGTAGGGPATTYAESEGGGMNKALSEAANLSSSVGDLASLGYFPPPAHVQEKEREAYLEPVFADQSDSSDESVEDEDEIQDEELVNRAAAKDAAAGEPSMGRHFSNLSSGALSDGGWSGRVMENIGEDEEDEPEVVDDSKLPATATIASRPESIRSPTVEFEDYGLGLGALGSGTTGAQREIRALTITTSTAPAPSITSHAAATSSPAIGVGLSLNTESGPSPSGGVVASPLALTVGAGGLPEPGTAGAPATQSEESATSTVGPPATTTAPTPEPPKDGTPTPPTPQSPPSAASNPRVVLRRPSESIARTLSATSSAGAGVSPDGAPSPGLPSSAGSGGASGYRGFGGYGLAPANRPYHPALSERGPGNPLFPSSFAGLSVGPTLVANVPKVSRSSSVSRTHHYPSSLAPGSGSAEASNASAGGQPPVTGSPSSLKRYMSLGETAAHRRAALRNTWADVRDRYEYAVTVASASSDGGRG